MDRDRNGGGRLGLFLEGRYVSVFLSSFMVGLSAISTWNVWGVPFVSPNMLSRMLDVREFFDKQMRELRVDQSGLVVACFQEAWSFRAGPIHPLLELISRKEHEGDDGFSITPPDDRLIRITNNSIFSLISQVLMILFGWMPGDRWDQKDQLIEAEKTLSLPYAVGTNGLSTAPLQMFTIVDSGLVILASASPLESGFEPYPRTTASGEELLNHKGVLWAFWHDETVSTLVMTTHTTANMYGGMDGIALSRKDGLEQLRFLQSLLVSLRKRFVDTAPTLEIYVTGDFNYNIENPDMKEFIHNTGLIRLSTNEPTFRDGNTIDHIFTSAENVTAQSTPPPAHTVLSDHALLVLPSISRTT